MDSNEFALKSAIVEVLLADGFLRRHTPASVCSSKIAFVGCRDPRCHWEHAQHMHGKHRRDPVGYGVFGGGSRLSPYMQTDIELWQAVVAMVHPRQRNTPLAATRMDRRHRQAIVEAIAVGVLLLGHEVVDFDNHAPKCLWAARHGAGLHQQLWWNHHERMRLERLANQPRREWLRLAEAFGQQPATYELRVYETLHWHTDAMTGHDHVNHATWSINPHHPYFRSRRFSLGRINTMSEREFLQAIRPDATVR